MRRDFKTIQAYTRLNKNLLGNHNNFDRNIKLQKLAIKQLIKSA